MSKKYRLSFDSFYRETEDEKEKPLKIFFLSVEGNKTEVDYFNELSKYREVLGINAKIDVEVLKRSDSDTNSSMTSVLGLLEEFKNLRKFSHDERGLVQEVLRLTGYQYSAQIIEEFIHDSESLDEETKDKISTVLQKANYDVIYKKYLLRRCNEDDELGIVIDRDRQAHKKSGLIECLNYCKSQDFHCYITNPCFEFWLLLHLVDVRNVYCDCLDVILQNRRDSNRHTFLSKEVSNLAGHGKSFANFTINYLPHVDDAILHAKDFESDEYQLADKLGTNLWKLIEQLRVFVPTEDSV